MLVLTRKPDQGIIIGDNIRVRVIKAEHGQLKLTVEAPKDIPVLREEIYEGNFESDGTGQAERS